MYKKIIDFLAKYYSGTITWTIGNTHLSGVKPYLGYFFLLWGIFKILQVSIVGIVYWAWWDYIMTLLVIPQILAGFSNVILKEQKRLEEKEKYNL